MGTGLFVEPRLMKVREKLALRHMKKAISDPELRRKVTPNYRMGCKRILPSNDWYPALARENVDLVTEGISKLTKHAVVTSDGNRYEVDVVVLCTGFNPRGTLGGYDCIGLGGKNLADIWHEDPEAYFGIMASGFPNFFVMVGPNTGLGHNSIVFMIEAQLNFIMECLDLLASGRYRALDVRAAEQRQFNERLQKRMNNVVWSTGCNSWYLDETGKNYTLWPGSTVEYWLRTRHVDPAAFQDASKTG
jgi:cation diffusion facilitator CzcD-associated flavoprotein CzcO